MTLCRFFLERGEVHGLAVDLTQIAEPDVTLGGGYLDVVVGDIDDRATRLARGVAGGCGAHMDGQSIELRGRVTDGIALGMKREGPAEAVNSAGGPVPRSPR